MAQWLQGLKVKRNPESKVTLPFFLILTLVLVGVAVQAIISEPELHAQPIRLSFFIVLVLFILTLHWLSLAAVQWSDRASILFLSAQATLAFTATLLSGSVMVAYGTFMALIGETIGILRKRSFSVVAVIVSLALSGISTYIIDGSKALQSWAFTIIPVTIFVVIYVNVFLQQLEARAEAQALARDLEQANRQLADYAVKIESLTLSTERQRMARELHDTLAQGLAGLILQLEAADSHLANGHSERAQAIVHQAMERARLTLTDARNVIANLRSGLENTSDLEQVIRREVERFSSASGIACDLTIELPPTLSQETSEHLIRILTEGLSNIARHARASQASVRIEPVNGMLEAEVNDNGTGFDPEATMKESGHYGLLGLRERARLAGGQVEISSQPNSGTTILLRLPMEKI